MADYGVNIKVGVQGQNNAKQLGEQIREIVRGLEAADRAFTQFSNNLKSFDQRRAQRKINEELDKTAQKYRELDRLQRQLRANDDSAIRAERRQNKTREFISRRISEVRARQRSAFLLGDPAQYPSGANQPFAPDPMVAIRKQRDAEAKFAREIFDIEQDFARRHNNTQIELLTQRIKREMDLQEDAFQNALRLDKAFMKDHDRRAKAAFEARGQQTRLTGQTSPIGGAVGIPGSPAALRAAEQAQRLRSASSSALIGGAFPLLFGQGLGAAGGGLIGGFGGGMIGGEFGFGLSLIGTQLGSLIDQFATKASELGAALNPLTADIEAVAAAAGESNTEFGQLLSAYEEELGAKEALEFATNRLATVVGIDGVNALSTFNADMVEAGNEFSKFTSIVLAAIADLINQSGFLRGAANLAERSRLLISAQRSGDPEIQKLMKQRQAAQSKVQPFLAELDPGKVAGQIGTVRQIEDQIILLQRANEAKELGLQQDELSVKLSEKQLQGLRGSRAELEAQNVILRNNGDLLKDEVFNAEKTLLTEKMRAKVAQITKTQAEAEVKLSKEAFDEQLSQAVLDYNNDLLALTNRRADAQQAADDKAARAAEAAEKAADRATEKAEREDRRKQRAIEKRIKATDTEIERATRAFERVDSQLDDIINKNKDKVAFEREYAELIRGGSTPAAAQQAIELKKQLLELDRRYEKEMKALDAQLAKTELVILEQIAVDGVTDAIKRQIEEYNRLKDVRDGLAEKKEGAEGAINEALAPKSDRERLQEYLDKLQGQLNDLNDPVRQITALAETLGSAFSESFKGIVDGSMSAREALANLFQRTADHFLDMAAQMIAAQIKMQAVNLFMSFFPSSFTPLPGSAPQMKPGAVVTPTGFQGQFDGFAANGGPVTGGKSYIVGERGPELFTPGVSGGITPNHALGGANVTVNVDASGSSVEGNADQASQLGKAIGVAVQQELIKQKRPGGLLAS